MDPALGHERDHLEKLVCVDLRGADHQLREVLLQEGNGGRVDQVREVFLTFFWFGAWLVVVRKGVLLREEVG